MEEIKIKGFENTILDLCNKTPMPWRTKYYVLKDLAQKCLEASEKDCQMALAEIEKQKEQKGGTE